MAWWSYSFICTIHHPTIIIIQTYLKVLNFQNACQVHSVKCVSKIRSVLCVIYHVIYGAVCILLIQLSDDDCVNTCNLSRYHHRIVSMINLSLFRVRSWNNGMRCMSFHILMYAVKMLSCVFINVSNVSSIVYHVKMPLNRLNGWVVSQNWVNLVSRHSLIWKCCMFDGKYLDLDIIICRVEV